MKLHGLMYCVTGLLERNGVSYCGQMPEECGLIDGSFLQFLMAGWLTGYTWRCDPVDQSQDPKALRVSIFFSLSPSKYLEQYLGYLMVFCAILLNGDLVFSTQV